jgi:ribosome-binding ATPase YchF (GTP1/OBG family)
LEKGWEKVSRQAHMSGQSIAPVIHDRLTGLGVTDAQVLAAIRDARLPENAMNWGPDEMRRIAEAVRRYSKPMIIALNKADLADDATLGRLTEAAGGMTVPTMAEAELALKRAAKAKLVSYVPGDDHFEVTEPSKLNANQTKALEKIGESVKRVHGTGVQACLEKAAFELLDLIIVYPVEDETRLTDHDGRVLPDAFLVPKGTTARGLAYKVHTDLGENFIRAINVRTHRTVGHDYELQDNDVLTIVSRK